MWSHFDLPLEFPKHRSTSQFCCFPWSPRCCDAFELWLWPWLYHWWGFSTGDIFLLGGQGSNSGATCRNVEECHGRKKGVGYMSMSMVLFSLFKVYFGWSERLRCNRWLELDGTCGTWYQFIIRSFFWYRTKKNTPTFSPTIGSGLPFYTLLLGYAAATFITEVGGDLGFFWGCKLQWVWAYAM